MINITILESNETKQKQFEKTGDAISLIEQLVTNEAKVLYLDGLIANHKTLTTQDLEDAEEIILTGKIIGG